MKRRNANKPRPGAKASTNRHRTKPSGVFSTAVRRLAGARKAKEAAAPAAIRRMLAPEHASEPVFSCAECVARMNAIHWHNVGEEGTVVLMALRDGGPGTFGEVIRRVRWSSGHETPSTARRKVRPLYRLMQALTTLVAEGLVKTKGVRGAQTKSLLKSLSQFEFWCSACETHGKLTYKRRPEYNGMTGRYYNKGRMVLECKCGAVHAEQQDTKPH